MTHFVDLNNFYVPSILRRFIKRELGQPFHLDKKTSLKLGDIVIASTPIDSSLSNAGLSKSNGYMERIIDINGDIKIRNEAPNTNKLFFAVAGNRFSTKVCAGGINNPITGELNSPLYPGDYTDNLANYNLIGRTNYLCSSEELIKVKIEGRVILKNGVAANLYDYNAFNEYKKSAYSKPTIIIVGDESDCGKTTCCAHIAKTGNTLGLNFAYQKATGGPRIRDLASVCCNNSSFNKIGDKISLNNLNNAIDFSDLGYPSSHSVPDMNKFAKESAIIGKRLATQQQADMLIIEIAGNIHQPPNIAVLNAILSSHKKIYFIAVLEGGIESMYSLVGWLKNKVEFPDQIAISGPITQSLNARLLESIAEHELKTAWVPCKSTINTEWRDYLGRIYF